MNIAALRPLIIGNWKMHGLLSSLTESSTLARLLAQRPFNGDVVICPPTTLIEKMAQTLLAGPVQVGAQNCHAEVRGAHTGEISAGMLVDVGASFVILGHSERRHAFGENDSMVAAKATAAMEAGLHPVICVGETLRQRQSGEALGAIQSSLRAALPIDCRDKPISIAYEPRWSIGAGLTPSSAQIGQAHAAIRSVLIERNGPAGYGPRIVYGGSVTPQTIDIIAAAPDVCGVLLGGASLTSDQMAAVIYGFQKAYARPRDRRDVAPWPTRAAANQ